MDSPDFLKITHSHEDKRFDRLDELFPKFKDEVWNIKEKERDDEEAPGPDVPSEQDQ